MHDFLTRLGISERNPGAASTSGFFDTHGRVVDSFSPTTGQAIAGIQLATADDYETVVSEAQRVFREWRHLPAPKRGEILREVGDALRTHKEDIGRLISLEVGKIRSEGEGEVQESVDMADFCVGISRQLYGLSMHSERPSHRMYEQWHPLGVVGVITAFNFPNAVWAWNAMVAAACGDTVIWKPSLKAPLTAIATHRVCDAVFQKHGWGGVFNLIIGDDADVGEALVADRRVPLISATGSCRMGRVVGAKVAQRLGRCLLELGGNNAVIVNKDADLDLALRGVAFGAVGTSGQRCTSTRRIFLHEDIASDFITRLVSAYGTLPIGDPMEDGTLVGPLIDEDAVAQCEAAIVAIREAGRRDPGGGCPGRRSRKLRPAHGRTRPGRRLDPSPARRPSRPSSTCSPTGNLSDAIATPERRRSGPVVGAVHRLLPRRRDLPLRRRLRLRHRQHQYRHQRGRDRRRLRRREGHRRWPRGRKRRLEGLYAPPDLHAQLGHRPSPRPGRGVPVARIALVPGGPPGTSGARRLRAPLWPATLFSSGSSCLRRVGGSSAQAIRSAGLPQQCVCSSGSASCRAVYEPATAGIADLVPPGTLDPSRPLYPPHPHDTETLAEASSRILYSSGRCRASGRLDFAKLQVAA